MIDFALLFFLVVCAVAAIQMRDLLSSIMLLGIYSFIMAVVWTRLNAVDVAFTEASVGAGITTILLIAALSRTRRMETKQCVPPANLLIYGTVILLTSAVLLYGTLDMPTYGDPGAPAHSHVAPRYLEKSFEEVGVPNVVTAVLASYRGYDTLGETTVIFGAGICVILLLRRKI
jgi:multicomponent Na+:H+ antiporter subunit B